MPHDAEMPALLTEAIERLREGRVTWDSERWMRAETLRARPLLPLVEAFLASGERGPRALRFFCLFAARRVLPAWTLYCDGRRPHRAVVALEAYLATGVAPADADELVLPAEPSFGGVAIRDHRECDTGSAAQAVARAVGFALGGDPMDAMECLSAAGAAIDQSPLVAGEDFPKWIIEVAIPVAWECRELTAVEREVHRDYDWREVTPGDGPPAWR